LKWINGLACKSQPQRGTAHLGKAEADAILGWAHMNLHKAKTYPALVLYRTSWPLIPVLPRVLCLANIIQQQTRILQPTGFLQKALSLPLHGVTTMVTKGATVSY